MKISDLLAKTGWKSLGTYCDQDREVSGVYCGDLLSWVMGRGKTDQAWVTVQVHENVIAVALLREFSCIILADNASAPEEFYERAAEEQITVIASGLPVFETAKVLVELNI